MAVHIRLNSLRSIRSACPTLSLVRTTVVGHTRAVNPPRVGQGSGRPKEQQMLVSTEAEYRISLDAGTNRCPAEGTLLRVLHGLTTCLVAQALVLRFPT